MTTIEKEAKERARDYTENKERRIAYECGFLDGADRMKEELEKENAELEARIERMMCCGNCIYFNFNEPNYCRKGVYRECLYVCNEWKFGN